MGMEIILAVPDRTPRDVGQGEARFSPFGDSVSLDVRLVHDLNRTCNRRGSHFGRTRWNSYVMWVKWRRVSVSLEKVLVSTQDRCTVCAKRTIGSEISLDAPDGTPR